MVLLQASEPDEVAQYLVARGVIGAADGPVQVAAAGDGNMNCTLRVITPRRRLIVKQARPWVEKYDHIPAPWNRSHVEAAFYESVAAVPGVGDRMPGLIHVDRDARVLVLEDLGDGGDFTSMYTGSDCRSASATCSWTISCACDTSWCRQIGGASWRTGKCAPSTTNTSFSSRSPRATAWPLTGSRRDSSRPRTSSSAIPHS